MAGAMGNTMAINSIDGFLDRRRVAAQSPSLGPQQQQQQQHQQQGSNLRTVSTGNASATTAAANLATSATAASNTMIAMNEHDGHSPYHRRSIQSLLEIIKEDLNLYGECMIPVGEFALLFSCTFGFIFPFSFIFFFANHFLGLRLLLP